MGRVDAVGPGPEPEIDGSFAAFVDRSSPALLRALVAGFGPDIGREATVDALAWGWEHWERVGPMRNPAGYLYRVGQTQARRALRRASREEPRSTLANERPYEDMLGDPELERALSQLSPRQRAAVILVIGHDLSQREAAEQLGCSVSSLRNHVDRALRHLRVQLGVVRDDR
ncbi:MAG TPA: sigma-70 family RNA polymerase sigma factor [Acidimicrobiia bacterium]|jgi:RNA polymerase sigma factor (sigma-70 family)|nr:sigma-70 family RNA polymerase sigma factor [Acidimicrobiia bacterium]